MNKNKLKAQFLLKGKVLGMRMENKETNFHKYIADKWIDVEVFDNYPTKEEILEAVNQSEEEIDSVHIKLVYKVEEKTEWEDINLSKLWEGWDNRPYNKEFIEREDEWEDLGLNSNSFLNSNEVVEEDKVPIEEQEEYITVSDEFSSLAFGHNYSSLSTWEGTGDVFNIRISNEQEDWEDIALNRNQLEFLQVKMKEVLDAYDNLVEENNIKEEK